MAIAPWTEFDYVADFDADSFEPGAVTLHARSRVESAEPVLVGHRPKIRFWNDLVHLEASDASLATFRRAAFAVGDAVLQAARAKDTLRLARTSTGDLALSIMRDGRLALAFGAIAELSLGVHLSVTNGFADTDAWLDVVAPGHESCRLRARESARVGGYDVYLERACAPDDDGDGWAECASIALAVSPPVVNAAMRSAVLLGSAMIDVPRWQQWNGQFVSPSTGDAALETDR